MSEEQSQQWQDDVSKLIDLDISLLQKLKEQVHPTIREETLQNQQISICKQHQHNQKRQSLEGRLNLLQKFKEVKEKNTVFSEELKESSKQINVTEVDPNVYWQVVSNIERLAKSKLTFLSDENVFLKGKEVFSLLRFAFKLFTNEDLVPLLEATKEGEDKSISEQKIKPLTKHDEAIDTLLTGGANQLFFLDLENLTPEKLLFVARLQQEQNVLANKRLIVYSDDVFAEQMKEQLTPEVEIVFQVFSMPKRIVYAENEVLESQKPKEIVRICKESIAQYKQSLMRFDLVIFVKNSEEAERLRKEHLNLQTEKLSFIDVTEKAETEQEPKKTDENKKSEEEINAVELKQGEIKREEQEDEMREIEVLFVRPEYVDQEIAPEIAELVNAGVAPQQPEIAQIAVPENIVAQVIPNEVQGVQQADVLPEVVEEEAIQPAVAPELAEFVEEAAINPAVLEPAAEVVVAPNVVEQEIVAPEVAEQAVVVPEVAVEAVVQQEVAPELAVEAPPEVAVEIPAVPEVPVIPEAPPVNQEELHAQAEQARLARQALPFAGIVEENPEEGDAENIDPKEVSAQTNGEYKKNEFNVFLATSYKQLQGQQLQNVLVQIDSGEAEKVYFIDSMLESVPTVSLKITHEEALKRERLMGQHLSCNIHRLITKKEFLRLQKRDSLNLLNIEAQKEFKEITSETSTEKQALRMLLHIVVNFSENWFSCSSETSAHVSLLWSRMGDIHSIYNCLLKIPQENTSPFAKDNSNFQQTLEKNQVSAARFNALVYQLREFPKQLGLTINPIAVIREIEASVFSELIQQIVIEKHYKNLCVYSGHRRHGFKHFESGKKLNYADLCSMRLIQERPFLLIPLQLSINSKNQIEIKQCMTIEHAFLLENAPTEFVEKHKLRLLKRQSLNLQELEYFGISNSLFSYFEAHSNLITAMEQELDCYYEPNFHMDTITLHCDAMHKDRVEKRFKDIMETAQKELLEETFEFPNGNNSIVKIQKGGIVKEIVILENQHVFIVEGLPLDVKEQELIDYFGEYGDILNVQLSSKGQEGIDAEILVAETEDAAFFVEVFDKTEYRGQQIQVRQKGHSFKIHEMKDTTKYYNTFRWQTWKSKLQGKMEFADENAAQEFLKLVEAKLTIDGKDIQASIDKDAPRVVIVKNLCRYTDETTLKDSLPEVLKANLTKTLVERLADVDRGVSKAALLFAIKKVHNEKTLKIQWIRKQEDGFVEAKVLLPNNLDTQLQADTLHGKPDVLGQGKLYVKHSYTQLFTYDLKMKDILHVILAGNAYLVEKQQSKEIILSFKVVRPVPSKQEYLMKLKCFDSDIFERSKEIINALLTAQKLDLRNIKVDLATLFDETDQVDYSQIFTEIGQKMLKELEQKYPAYFKVNLFKQDVRVYCTNATYDLINKEVEYFLRQSIRIKIPVSGKNIRNVLGMDGKGLEELKEKFQVCKIQLDCISKDVYMEGNSKQIDKAKNALLALLEEKNSSAFANNTPYSTEDCMVCSDTITTGYRLQGCSHKFCLSCVMFIVENSLGDVNSLPIKCPFCSQAFVIKDLLALLNEEQFDKMQRMSLNNYVQKHFEEVNFCVNENCRSVHSSKLSKYTCYECKKTYCSKCAVEYHFGLTCSVYQETEAKNVAFLLKEGARKCPKCGVYIIRFDGCYRVECQRCNSHICWKDNCMIYFDNSSDCYNHLDEKHGGYW